jgi:two-component system sensor histidine kinase BaeS
LTTSFNMMASQLATTEHTRRRLLNDLRTPLASMQATIEAVTDGILPPDSTTLATLTEQSQRLHRLVGDLSSVSRAEERQLNLHPVLVPAQDLVSGAVAAARPRFDAKGVSLTTEGGATIPGVSESVVQQRPHGLRQPVRVDHHLACGGAVNIAVTLHHDRCQIAVTDTSEGFDPGQAAQLFERFYRGDSSRSSGNPFSPSQTTKKVSFTPRLRRSVNTLIQNFAPSPPVPAHKPRTSFSPARLTPIAA